MTDIQSTFLVDALTVFRKQKSLGERALAQLPDDALFSALDGDSNSIAVIVKHLHGNMRSRWTDFLTTDGEKSDRKRDQEFEASERSRSQVMTWWEDGWRHVFEAISALSPEDVTAAITIRGEKMRAMSAIVRQIDHYGQHVGQIILLAKHACGPAWVTLSIPRGKSQQFNEAMQSVAPRP